MLKQIKQSYLQAYEKEKRGLNNAETNQTNCQYCRLSQKVKAYIHVCMHTHACACTHNV